MESPSVVPGPPAAPTASAIHPPTGPFPLLLLPHALYNRVLHFVSAEHKLNQLSCLCRHATPLSPTAFHYSHLELSIVSIASRPCDLLVPPAALGVHSLSIDLRHLPRHLQDRMSSYASLRTVLAALLPTIWSRFTSLRELCIRLHSHNANGYDSAINANEPFFATLIPSSAAFPHLERLAVLDTAVTVEKHSPGARGSYSLGLSTLAGLPSLQHLSLWLPFQTDDYADILTLPNVRTISLCNETGTWLPMPLSVLTALPSLLSPSCRSLTLPQLLNDLPGMPHGLPHLSSPEPANQLMELIRKQAAGRAVGLQYLAVTGRQRNHALLLAPAFPSLTALRVDGMRYQHDAAAVLPALADLPALQHISIAIGGGPDKAVWEQFLGRAGPRLRTVHLRELVCVRDEVNEWISRLLQHCTGLESLVLVMRDREDTCGSTRVRAFASRPLSATLSSLARLHTLGVYALQLTNEEVDAMLHHCPLLEDCTIKTPWMSAGMLSVLGRCCPLLRRVWLEGQGEELLNEMAADSLLACVQPCGVEQAVAPCSEWFQRLHTLYIDWTHGYYPGPQHSNTNGPGPGPAQTYSPTADLSPPYPISPRLTGLLPRLLAAAPLRYLHQPVDRRHSASVELQWSSKQQLRAIDLFATNHPAYHHCTQPNPYARQQQVGEFPTAEEEEEWWTAASDSSMAAEWRSLTVWPRVFREAGCGGRAENFAKLQCEEAAQLGLIHTLLREPLRTHNRERWSTCVLL